MVKGKRGGGKEHLLLWEELPYLKVEPTGKPVAIYKREDVQKELPLEQKNYYAHFPIRGTRGKRKSLLVTTREVPQTPPDDHLDIWNARKCINRKTNYLQLNP